MNFHSLSGGRGIVWWLACFRALVTNMWRLDQSLKTHANASRVANTRFFFHTILTHYYKLWCPLVAFMDIYNLHYIFCVSARRNLFFFQFASHIRLGVDTSSIPLWWKSFTSSFPVIFCLFFSISSRIGTSGFWPCAMSRHGLCSCEVPWLHKSYFGCVDHTISWIERCCSSGACQLDADRLYSTWSQQFLSERSIRIRKTRRNTSQAFKRSIWVCSVCGCSSCAKCEQIWT